MPLAAAGNTFLKAMRNVYAMAAPPAGVNTMPVLYLDEAPEGTGYPRAIITHEEEVPDPDSWDEKNQNAARNLAFVTIRLYSENDSDLAEDLAISVRSVFKPRNINLTFDQWAVIKRVRYKVSLMGIRSENDLPVYEAAITYRGEFGTDD